MASLSEALAPVAKKMGIENATVADTVLTEGEKSILTNLKNLHGENLNKYDDAHILQVYSLWAMSEDVSKGQHTLLEWLDQEKIIGDVAKVVSENDTTHVPVEPIEVLQENKLELPTPSEELPMITDAVVEVIDDVGNEIEMMGGYRRSAKIDDELLPTNEEVEPPHPDDLTFRQQLSVITDILAQRRDTELRQQLMGLVSKIYHTRMVTTDDALIAIAESNRKQDLLLRLLQALDVHPHATQVSEEFKVGSIRLDFGIKGKYSLQELEIGFASALLLIQDFKEKVNAFSEAKALYESLSTQLVAAKKSLTEKQTQVTALTNQIKTAADKPTPVVLKGHPAPVVIRWTVTKKLPDDPDVTTTMTCYLTALPDAEPQDNGMYMTKTYRRTNNFAKALFFPGTELAKATIERLGKLQTKISPEAKITPKNIAKMQVVTLYEMTT